MSGPAGTSPTDTAWIQIPVMPCGFVAAGSRPSRSRQPRRNRGSPQAPYQEVGEGGRKGEVHDDVVDGEHGRGSRRSGEYKYFFLSKLRRRSIPDAPAEVNRLGWCMFFQI